MNLTKKSVLAAVLLTLALGPVTSAFADPATGRGHEGHGGRFDGGPHGGNYWDKGWRGDPWDRDWNGPWNDFNTRGYPITHNYFGYPGLWSNF